MVETLKLENSLSKLGKSELIMTGLLTMLRIKYPTIFTTIFEDAFSINTNDVELQFMVILGIGFISGLMINLFTESSEIFINSTFYRFINSMFKKMNNEEEEEWFNLNMIAKDYKCKLAKTEKYSPLSKFHEPSLVYYNLVRTLGNRYSKQCDTILAENRYRHSAYFIVYGFLLLATLVLLSWPPYNNYVVVISIVSCMVAIVLLFYSSYISFKRLVELMHLAVADEELNLKISKVSP